MVQISQILLYFSIQLVLIFTFMKRNLEERRRNKKNKKRSDTQKIEELILKYKNLEINKSKKKTWTSHYSKKLQYLLKIFPLKENVSLYLLRNNLYRILKAPRGTFTEFKRLFSEITNELKEPKQNDFILLNNNI